ncbi:hypothetical protein JDV02_004247 [Purpureocillium takamizusanense]|uniref:Uncharacterized protein n=1 Tax=Purpureocillium takamizusanense TaxID=2060973 RepID=A0A9Q8VAM3_9HYPO|nr:uncharacterized protein JDV02_004247 [Purpureocillium takamizusanense]UNI17942.1 hypothetical protein JDV02_004247 [Purpureocillium takamizusanense]
MRPWAQHPCGGPSEPTSRALHADASIFISSPFWRRGRCAQHASGHAFWGATLLLLPPAVVAANPNHHHHHHCRRRRPSAKHQDMGDEHTFFLSSPVLPPARDLVRGGAPPPSTMRIPSPPGRTATDFVHADARCGSPLPPAA